MIAFKPNRDIQPSGYISDVCSIALVHSDCAAYISCVIEISRSVSIVVTQNGQSILLIIFVTIYNGSMNDNITY